MWAALCSQHARCRQPKFLNVLPWLLPLPSIAWQALSINGNQFAEAYLLVPALKTARQLRALCVSDPGIREWAQIKVGRGGEGVVWCGLTILHKDLLPFSDKRMKT
jgi:hypothetical protein